MVREFMTHDPAQGAEKELVPLRARSDFGQSVRPWHPVDPAVKSVLSKADGKLNETGPRQQFTLDGQLRGWIFRIGGPLRLKHDAGNSDSPPGRKPKGSRFHSR